MLCVDDKFKVLDFPVSSCPGFVILQSSDLGLLGLDFPISSQTFDDFFEVIGLILIYCLIVLVLSGLNRLVNRS